MHAGTSHEKHHLFYHTLMQIFIKYLKHLVIHTKFDIMHIKLLLARLNRDNGWAKVKKTVPDTITKWVAGAFCVSPVGFGVSPNTGLTVSKPLFVSLTLPYSVIRGESFVLKATVFSDLPKCIQVNIYENG